MKMKMKITNCIDSIRNFVTLLPRNWKKAIAISVDISLIVISMWFSFYLRLGEFISLSSSICVAVGLSIILVVALYLGFGVYNEIFRYSDLSNLTRLFYSTSIYGVVFSSIYTLMGVQEIPRTIGIIQPLILMFLVSISRVITTYYLSGRNYAGGGRKEKSNVLIYGAGQSGRQLMGALSNNFEMKVIGFLDDDCALHGQFLLGKKIYDPRQLVKIVTNSSVSHILLAMPKLERNRRNQILNNIRLANVAVRSIPSVSDQLKNSGEVSNINDLDVDDLLGRESVLPDENLLSKHIENRRVMVTGAGGSIGSELCRQIVQLKPLMLVLVDVSEYNLYAISQELECEQYKNIVILPILANVQNRERIFNIVEKWKPNIIYHAAAYKHVPIVEHNPVEGIKNNVFGTLNIVQAAIFSEVQNFVLISTDKAVRPTNVMGASKRLAEMCLQALSPLHLKTNLSMVRFGNVLDSSGSVVPKFKQQIRNGGPITVTHPEITRYFMTIPEASQLVIQAGALAAGGDVFVLDMGKPIKILELAERMVELSGYKLKRTKIDNGEIEIVITGLRPGEKLYEELLIGKNPIITQHPRIMKANDEYVPWDLLENTLHKLEEAIQENNINLMRAILLALKLEYSPSIDNVDWMTSDNPASNHFYH
jgi:FlaA1/EpsC-like NDP-sugar epimerase